MHPPPQIPRSPHLSIRPAQFPAERDLLRQLFLDYQEDIQVDLCFQSFDEELRNLERKYATILVAERDGGVIGCVALRRMDADLGEMKRLFVYPEGRGTGVGRALVGAIISEARALGMRALRLDTIATKMPSAVALYRSLGFLEIPAYTDNSLPGMLFLELDLLAQPQVE